MISRCFRKFVAAGRRDQHAGRVRSPEYSRARLRSRRDARVWAVVFTGSGKGTAISECSVRNRPMWSSAARSCSSMRMRKSRRGATSRWIIRWPKSARRFPNDLAMAEALALLPRDADRAAAGVGMRGDVHHVVDEAGRAHRADFAHAPAALSARGWNSNGRELFRLPHGGGAWRSIERGGPARVRARLSREDPARRGTHDRGAEWSISTQRSRRWTTRRRVTELCRLPGVGEKVANCALLFRLRAGAGVSDRRVDRAGPAGRFTFQAEAQGDDAAGCASFRQTYFGPYGGYAQQYLFHHARKTMRKAWNDGARMTKR